MPEGTKCENRIMKCVLGSLLTIVSLLGIMLTFYEPFYHGAYSMAMVIILTLILSVLFNGLLVYTKATKWVLFGLLGILGLIVWFSQEAVFGGFIRLINIPIEALSNRFETDLTCFDEPIALMRQAKLSMVISILTALLVPLHAFLIQRVRLMVIPLVIGLFSFAFSVLVEIDVPVRSMVLELACLIAYVGMGMAVIIRQKESGRYVQDAHVAGIILWGFIMVVGNIAAFFIPQKDFKRAAFFEEVEEKGTELGKEMVSQGEQLVETIANGGTIFDYFREMHWRLPQGPGLDGLNITNSIGGGQLGQAQSIQAANEEVLIATVPLMPDSENYIMGFVGSEYVGENTATSYACWKEGSNYRYHSDVFAPQTSISTATNLLYDQFYYYGLQERELPTAYKCQVEFTGTRKTRQFVPYYPVPTMQIYGFNGDGTFKEIPSSISMQYYQFSEEDIRKIRSDLLRVRDTKIIHDDYTKEYLDGVDYYDDYVYNHYLTLNTTCGDRLVELMREIGNPFDTTGYTTAAAVKDFLSKHCRYTLSPGTLPDGKDFVEYFLYETQEGYCTYFASAAVMMMRAAGIPARYVEGYTFNTRDGEVKRSQRIGSAGGVTYVDVSVKDTQAHAWMEFYIKGLGWIPYEVTPGFHEGGIATPQPSETTHNETKPNGTTTQQTSTQNPTTKNPSETTKPSASLPNVNPHTPSKPGINQRDLRKIGIATAVSLVVGLLVLFFILRHKKAKAKLHQILTNENRVGRIILLNYTRLESIVGYDGVRRGKGENYQDFAKRIAKRFDYITGEEAATLTALFEKVQFGQMAEIEDARLSTMIVERVRDRALMSMGIIKRWIFCYLLNR